MSRKTQRLQALALANDRRVEIAVIRGELRRGERNLIDVVNDPPEALEPFPVATVLAWSFRWGTYRIAQMNRVAIRHSINLLLPLGETSTTTRAWLVDYIGRREHYKPALVEAERDPAPEPRRVDPGPFVAWLASTYPDSSPEQIGRELQMDPRRVRSLIDHEYEEIAFAIVDRALTVGLGRPDMLDTLYPYQEKSA